MQPTLSIVSTRSRRRIWTAPASRLAPLISVLLCGSCASDDNSEALAIDAGADAGYIEQSPATSNGTDETSDDGLFGGGDTVTVPPDQSDAGYSTTGESPANKPPLQSCPDATGGLGNPMIDDFETSVSGDNGYELPMQDGRQGSWFVFQDPSGGEQTLSVESTEGRAGSTTRALRTTGSGAFEWGQGFGAGLRWGTVDDSGEWIDCLYDASAYEGVSFWLRGTGGQVRLKLVTADVISKLEGGRCDEAASERCWDDHGVDLPLTDTWQLHQIPFAAVTQVGWGKNVGPFVPTELRLVEFQTAADVTFDIWLDDLSFYPDLRPVPGDAGADGGDADPLDGGAMDSGTAPDDAGATDAGSVPVADGGDADADTSSTPTTNVSPEAGTDASLDP